MSWEVLEESQHSICGSAGAPCAVLLGLDIKVLATRTEDSVAFYFLIHLTFSWLALKGSFVHPNSQRACTSCLSTFGVWGVMGRQHVQAQLAHVQKQLFCTSYFTGKVALVIKWTTLNSTEVTLLVNYENAASERRARGCEKLNFTHGTAEVFQLIGMLNQVTSSVKMRTHPCWQQNKLVLITALLLSLFRHSSLPPLSQLGLCPCLERQDFFLAVVSTIWLASSGAKMLSVNCNKVSTAVLSHYIRWQCTGLFSVFFF